MLLSTNCLQQNQTAQQSPDCSSYCYSETPTPNRLQFLCKQKGLWRWLNGTTVTPGAVSEYLRFEKLKKAAVCRTVLRPREGSLDPTTAARCEEVDGWMLIELPAIGVLLQEVSEGQCCGVCHRGCWQYPLIDLCFSVSACECVARTTVHKASANCNGLCMFDFFFSEEMIPTTTLLVELRQKYATVLRASVACKVDSDLCETYEINIIFD